jgi:nitroreductase
MSSLVSRAKTVYREEGGRSLLRRGVRFGLNKFYESVIWRILPKDKTLRAVASSRILTGLYFMFRGTFYREQRTLLCGAAEYHHLEEQRKAPRHRIIRSVHRIEKGLSMKDRRNVFAEEYIQDVVRDLRFAWGEDEDDEQLQWAVDVLAKYFDTVDDTEVIDKARIEFEEFLKEIEYITGDKVPFPRRELDDSPVSPDDLKQLASRRTSTRWFEQREVPRELIDESLEVAMQSPSACNRQSYEFRLFDDSELIEEVSSLAIGATGYNQNIPCLAVIVGGQRAYFDARDKHVIYIDASLAAMAFQFALETQGLASCCINWPAIPRNERQMADLLGLDCDENVIMLMAIGYPDSEGMIPYSEKKEVQSVRTFNKSAR